MIRQSGASDPGALRAQVESLTAQLGRLLEWFEDTSLKFEALSQAYTERQPDCEALVNGLLSYVPNGDSRINTLFQSGNLRQIYSDDMAIVRAPLVEQAAATQLRLVIDSLRQLAKYMPDH